MAVDFLYTANMDIFGELLKRLAWESTTNTKFNLAAADGTSSDVVLSHPSYPETVAAAYQRANDFLMTTKIIAGKQQVSTSKRVSIYFRRQNRLAGTG